MADEKDIMEALLTFVKDATALSRIYVGGLPEGVIDGKNPEPAAIMRRAPSSTNVGLRDNLPVAPQGFDLGCYGETRFEANKLLRKIAPVLRGLVRQTVGGVLLMRIIKTGAVTSLVDSDTGLPVEVQSFEVVAAI